MTEITVTKNDAGQRADRFLTKAYPNLSLPLICKLMRKKRIKLNGARTEPNVKRGGRVPVLPERRAA